MTEEKATPLDLGDEPRVADLPRARSLDWGATAAGRNLQRGLYAGVAVSAYTFVVANADEPLEQQIGDLLGDLRHLCDALGMDFADLNERGFRHYLDEIGGEG